MQQHIALHFTRILCTMYSQRLKQSMNNVLVLLYKGILIILYLKVTTNQRHGVLYLLYGDYVRLVLWYSRPCTTLLCKFADSEHFQSGNLHPQTQP
jgi:hypothetical protein